MTIEPNRYNILKEHNYELKEAINNFRERNFELQNENEKLKSTQQYLINDVRKYSFQALDLERKNKQLKERISKLVSENTNLQNDLFSEQLIQDETEDYINRLKQELFNLYLKHY